MLWQIRHLACYTWSLLESTSSIPLLKPQYQACEALGVWPCGKPLSQKHNTSNIAVMHMCRTLSSGQFNIQSLPALSRNNPEVLPRALHERHKMADMSDLFQYHLYKPGTYILHRNIKWSIEVMKLQGVFP